MTALNPTTEAVEAAARGWYEYTTATGQHPTWEEIESSSRHQYRESLLPLLTAAYPQIVADVLNHHADELERDARGPGVGYVAGVVAWLRAQAVEVQP